MAPSDDETRTDPGTGADWAEARLQHVLTIAAHDDERLLGARVALRDGRALVLGRGEGELADGALADPLASRRHAEVKLGAGAVRLTDLDSHNGSFVNGERASTATLAEGDVIGVGRTLLLYHRALPLLEPPRHPTLVGVGAALRGLCDAISRAAARNTTVLIEGETGTGKELVAEAIHRESGVVGRLVAVNCGAIAAGVIHSELFGHAKGAFSGADGDRAGLVRQAEDGSLFLDEVGDAPAELQVSLLRLLEQREYRAVGSDEPRRTNARFVAATHVPLERAVEEGRFRRDLHARIARAIVKVPPLRERLEDVVPLALHLARSIAGEPVKMGRDLALALLRHRWPGNVRELGSVVDQSLAETPEPGTLRLSPALAARLLAPSPQRGEGRGGGAGADKPDRSPKDRPPKDELRDRFLAGGASMTTLAEELGVARNTLYRWFREEGLDPDALRQVHEASAKERTRPG